MDITVIYVRNVRVVHLMYAQNVVIVEVMVLKKELVNAFVIKDM